MARKNKDNDDADFMPNRRRKNKNKDTVADYLEVLNNVHMQEAEEIVDSVLKNAKAHYEPKVHMRQVLVHMAMGKTVLETAYDMGFSVLTINLWRREHEEGGRRSEALELRQPRTGRKEAHSLKLVLKWAPPRRETHLGTH